MKTRPRSLFVAFLLVFVSGCQTVPQRPPELDLQLLETSELRIPSDCFASGSFIVEFTVATNGTTGDIRPPDAPTCIQDALTAWVASFRYQPPTQATTATIEWMLVSAKREM